VCCPQGCECPVAAGEQFFPQVRQGQAIGASSWWQWKRWRPAWGINQEEVLGDEKQQCSDGHYNDDDNHHNGHGCSDLSPAASTPGASRDPGGKSGHRAGGQC